VGEPRKILSNFAGLEAISAIRNIEIEVKYKIAKCRKGSAGVQGRSPGKF
jgi:hypothetical protein